MCERELNVVHYNFTTIYAITAENISESSKSNAPKNPTYKNFGHLNKSILVVWFCAQIYDNNRKT